MSRWFFAFVVVMSLFAPGFGIAAGGDLNASAIDGEARCEMVIGAESLVADASSLPDSNGAADDLSLAEASGDMPALVQMYSAPLVHITSVNAPMFSDRSVIPAPFIEGLKRPPRGLLATA
ncbi:hypothetical protein BH09PSE5_BH09PSE5_23280 [soil metagenome]